MTKIIDGKKIAQKILNEVKLEISKLDFKPKLAVIFVGSDKPSQTYVRRKQEAAICAGIDFEIYNFSANIEKEKLVKNIKDIQKKEKNIKGMIVQLPLPEPLFTSEVLDAVNPAIDVDCLTNTNIGKLVMKTADFTPPTPQAVLEIFKSIKLNIKGKNITIVGAGALVGKPLSIMLLNKEATITTCNEHTKDLAKTLKKSDIIISAVGKKNLIRKNMLKKNVIIIDTGIAFENKKMYGDVNFVEAVKKASFITPTPGGVGPITVSLLLRNLLICAKKK
ncbi:MAG: bifunctional methylenetetrahydrofolate dehydrogenase/methenyltetrahydrofolate cyclohydrolase [Candidatus Magasanikbacteria bacterium CG10_big_fil_rev_8_21_14_0_10_36_16]|uniref:Bifunctional protein FolD n=1 Tax=Candidatus Magasanikbacteria bacterium CG10_big_fil_rev_8_21_14_0_10_36_16 TaxID=1974645 RepID=A0A2H0TZK5_9BACT|nr:MAG: bifunctional methylenetetrahydrofolate dehydrogenase/methenyltetrahydrofolate cyclohydrolase [Candidatus Magasanikbacteria bacterium CG10_big_fil_rev_8_21_14_0_10_36_16]